MEVRDVSLVKETDPILKRVSDPVEGDVTRYEDILSSMKDIMIEYQGMGLSAPQVGISERFFIMKTEDGLRCCFNPTIINKSDKTVLLDEGCLSFPGLWLRVSRPTWVDVEYTDEKGEKISQHLGGIYAQCFEHELEHLNGITFDKKVSRLRLKIGKEKREKFLKRIKAEISKTQ